MAAMTFPLACIMEWNTNKVSDHNREPLSVSIERIEFPKRMANGTLRKYVVADKRTFSTSWKDLPHSAAFTVDGFWGGREMKNFYQAQKGIFDLKLNYTDGTSETVSVVFTRFGFSISKRGTYEFWNVDVEMEEV